MHKIKNDKRFKKHYGTLDFISTYQIYMNKLLCDAYFFRYTQTAIKFHHIFCHTSTISLLAFERKKFKQNKSVFKTKKFNVIYMSVHATERYDTKK